MLRSMRVLRVGAVPLISLFGNRNEFDSNLMQPLPDGPKTGMDRVKLMYTKNEFDEITPELNTVIQSTLTGSVIGAIMGGFVRSREAYLYFIENNQATIFKSTMQAKKKLQDYVTVAFGKGAFNWAWRMGLFTGIFSVVCTTISVYRDETSVIEYSVAGAIAGGLYRLNLGLAATLVGAGLGTILSTAVGVIIVLTLKVTGITMEEIRNALLKLREARHQQFASALEKSAEIKHDDLTLHHDAIVQERGEKKIDEI